LHRRADIQTIPEFPPTTRRLGKNGGDEADDDCKNGGDAIASRRRSQLYHDGCYEATLKINFIEADKTALVEYLKSL